jgi:hypothetical protein
MTEWRRLAPGTGGRDPAAVLALMQRAALANRRIRERSQEIAAWCGAIVEQATRDLTAVRARLEAAEAHADTAERRARAAETRSCRRNSPRQGSPLPTTPSTASSNHRTAAAASSTTGKRRIPPTSPGLQPSAAAPAA